MHAPTISDATCVCPDGSDDCQARIARSLITSAADAQKLFTPPINTTRLASSMAAYMPGTSINDCSAQALLLNLQSLDPSRYSKRSKWFKAVMLWDIASSEDFSSHTLRDGIDTQSYWLWQDSPSFTPEKDFQTLSHGYSVDTAYEKVFVPPVSIDAAQLSADQLARLNNDTSIAFTHVISLATAAATQRSLALAHLFAELGYTAQQQAAFLSAIANATVYFPFDVTASMDNRNMMDIASSQSSAGRTFPIPLGCQSGLSSAELQTINNIESDIFGLPEAQSLATFDQDCPNRPLYGILNIFNLPLPFLGSGVPQQAVAVMASVSSKMGNRGSCRTQIAFSPKGILTLVSQFYDSTGYQTPYDFSCGSSAS